MAALAVGLVLTMTGCSTPEPTGDDLYGTAADKYSAMAEGLHSVIMAVEPTDWAVDQGAHGAHPRSCQDDAGADGYFLNAVRTLALPDADVDALTASAVDAFASLGVEASVTTLGEGDAQERNIIGEGGFAQRTVVTIRTATGDIRVTTQTDCTPGSAHDLAALVFGEERLPADPWRRLPATEGPDSVPQFYFPPDGPVYYDEAGTPVEPQPLVTDPPTAPYED